MISKSTKTYYKLYRVPVSPSAKYRRCHCVLRLPYCHIKFSQAYLHVIVTWILPGIYSTKCCTGTLVPLCSVCLAVSIAIRVKSTAQAPKLPTELLSEKNRLRISQSSRALTPFKRVDPAAVLTLCTKHRALSFPCPCETRLRHQSAVPTCVSIQLMPFNSICPFPVLTLNWFCTTCFVPPIRRHTFRTNVIVNTNTKCPFGPFRSIL